MNIQKKLFELADEKYRIFHSKLMPTIDFKKIIGVRTPLLRNFAKDLYKTDFTSDFLKDLPHFYYEENNLHAFLIEQIKDYNLSLQELNKFLPYVDNWATCDMIRPKTFKNHLPELLEEINKWINSEYVYAVRFGIGMLMVYYSDENFNPIYLDMVAKISSDEYYIKMMIAWYFATELAKNWEDTLPYIELKKLDPWIHNKAIQKAIESRRITTEQKAYLRINKLRI